MTHADAKTMLRLHALDAEDLAVLSAHLQDAEIAIADLAYLPAEKRFALVGRRFDWVEAEKGGCERCAVGLHFERVMGAAFTGFSPGNGRGTLNLLAVEFAADDAPAGRIVLTFSAGAAIQLSVECIEAQMRDLGPRWPCEKTPSHPVER